MRNIYDLISEDIDVTIRKYLELKLIINPRYNRGKHCKYNKISSNREESGIDKSISYVRNFFKSFDDSQYIFMLFDNSFVQINYEFVVPNGQNEQVVSKANLVYYPNPGLYSEDIINDLQSIAEEEEREEYYSFFMEYNHDFQYASNYIRLDYDGRESSFSEFIHPRGHIHIGLHNNFRLGVNKLPLLSDFMDFVFYVNYIEKWVDIHSDGVEDLNNHLISKVKRKIIRKLTEHDTLTENEIMHYLVSL